MSSHCVPALLIGAISTIACVACDGAIPDDRVLEPGDSGKADDAVTDACVAAWSSWFLEQYAPMTCSDGATCVGRVALSTQPDCDGGVLHVSWMMALEKHVLGPWSAREVVARKAFYTYDTETFESRPTYIAALEPTPEENAAFEKLMAVPVLATVEDYRPWLGDFELWVATLAKPLKSPNNVLVQGRDLCVDVDLELCSAEPALLLNPSERELLRFLERAAPNVAGDGRFAAWVDGYYDLLEGDELAYTEFVFPENDMAMALFDYEFDFFQYLLSVAPEAVGERDSLSWFDNFTAVVVGTHLDQSNSVERLALFQASRPSQLVGIPAYESFLGMDGFISGLAHFDETDSEKLSLMLTAKPCARDADELAEMETLYRRYRGPAKASAGPVACAE